MSCQCKGLGYGPSSYNILELIAYQMSLHCTKLAPGNYLDFWQILCKPPQIIWIFCPNTPYCFTVTDFDGKAVKAQVLRDQSMLDLITTTILQARKSNSKKVYHFA